jgi:hypothetical protein
MINLNHFFSTFEKVEPNLQISNSLIQHIKQKWRVWLHLFKGGKGGF